MRQLIRNWGSLFFSLKRAGARDEHGSVKVVDMYGGPLTFRLVLFPYIIIIIVLTLD